MYKKKFPTSNIGKINLNYKNSCLIYIIFLNYLISKLIVLGVAIPLFSNPNAGELPPIKIV